MHALDDEEDPELSTASVKLASTEEAIVELPRCEIDDLSKQLELQICFAFLIAIHVVAFRQFTRGSGIQSWVALSGIGTLSVWVACTGRILRQRLMRAFIAILSVYVLASGSIQNLMIPGQSRFASLQRSIGLVVNNRVIYDRPTFVLLCWLLGALLSAYLVKWFVGFQFHVPGIKATRKILSIRTMLGLMLAVAMTSHLLRSPNWPARIMYFSNGMTLGVIASGMAWGVFQQDRWRRISYPLLVIMGVALLDLSAGRLLNAWSGDPLERLFYVLSFALSLSVSPLLSFWLLSVHGYEMTWSSTIDK